jgi:hypothetical protein
MGESISNGVLFVVVPLYVSSLPHPVVSLRESLLVVLVIAVYGFLSSLLRPVAGALSGCS